MKQLNRVGIKLVSPFFLEEEIVEKTKPDKPVLKYLVTELLKLMEIEPKSKYETYMEQAKRALQLIHCFIKSMRELFVRVFNSRLSET